MEHIWTKVIQWKWKSLSPIWLFAAQWNFPGQNTGVDSFFLLQGIFPTQGANPGLLHCRWILYQLSHEGSPRILEWVAYPFSSGPFQPRNWHGVSCIAGRLFTNWAIREAQSPFNHGEEDKMANQIINWEINKEVEKFILITILEKYG